MVDTPHIRAVTAAVDRWYRVQTPSAEGCMDGAIRVYLEAMKRAGWQLVPVEATEGMQIAAHEDMDDWRKMPHVLTQMKRHWSAMLAAAPDPTKGGEG